MREHFAIAKMLLFLTLRTPFIRVRGLYHAVNKLSEDTHSFEAYLFVGSSNRWFEAGVTILGEAAGSN